MPLALLVGPANAGKVASLLDRYLAALDRDPFLVVPNRGEVERVERDLLTRVPVLLGGWVCTFDDLFERLAQGPQARPLLTPLERALVIETVIGQVELAALRASARSPGFVDALGETLADLAEARVSPEEVGGELGELCRAYRDELDRLAVWDRESMRWSGVDRLAGELGSWSGRPVLVYGFDDLTSTQWGLIRALAGRCEVVVSLPYQPGRLAFEALERTATGLAGMAGDAVEELPAKEWYDAPALAHLERNLFGEIRPGSSPPLDGALRFLEGGGQQATLELLGHEILELLRAGADPTDIAVVVPSVEPLRGPIESAFTALGLPYTVRGRIRLSRTALGRSLLGLLRFAWRSGGRADLYAYLRSPYSGIPRQRVDYAEGRLRGKVVQSPQRIESETSELLDLRLRALEQLRAEEDPLQAVRVVADAMVRAAWGTDRPSLDPGAADDQRVREALETTLAELETWRGRGGALPAERVVQALEHATSWTREEPGRVPVIDLLEARTRRFQHVFVLGLQEGYLPRRSVDSPLLHDDERRALEAQEPGRSLVASDRLAADRYLFYTACTRPWKTLTLVREAASDAGRTVEPSPFWEEVRLLFDGSDVARATRRRPLSALTWPLEEAPTERERLRAVAHLAAADAGEAREIADANGWSRRLERALRAWNRPTRLTHPAVLDALRQSTRYSATELERFLDCSSMWFVERLISPKQIDRVIDAKVRGSVAHTTLQRFFAGLPRRFGTDTVDSGKLDEAVEFLGECLDAGIESGVRGEYPEMDVVELRSSLAHDLEHFLRREVELRSPLVPRHFEVSFGTAGGTSELQRGLDLGGFVVSGKIDRVDVDPFSARGIVQDYKSGKAFSAADIERSARLQIPLYILALRDLVGIEPLGGLYRSLSRDWEARGLARVEARDELPGLRKTDYLEDEEFWRKVDVATGYAREAVARMRDGDVRHDPRDGDCPSWCALWPMCRVARA